MAFSLRMTLVSVYFTVVILLFSQVGPYITQYVFPRLGARHFETLYKGELL